MNTHCILRHLVGKLNGVVEEVDSGDVTQGSKTSEHETVEEPMKQKEDKKVSKTHRTTKLKLNKIKNLKSRAKCWTKRKYWSAFRFKNPFSTKEKDIEVENAIPAEKVVGAIM